MRTASLALLLALALPACGGPPADAPPPGATADTTVSRADAALSRANRLEDRLALPDSRTRTVTEPDGREQFLRLWVENSQPVLLLVTDEERVGRPGSRTLYYFEGGELFLVSSPDARYVFEGVRLVERLDARLNPIEDQSPAGLSLHGSELQARVQRYLAAFEDEQATSGR
jgi:hypothetical protein